MEPTDQAGRETVHVPRELAPLVKKFLANRREDIAQMRAALPGGDYETVRLLGHSMKGIGRAYGFEAITIIGAALEQAARVSDNAAIDEQLAVLGGYLDRVHVEFTDAEL